MPTNNNTISVTYSDEKLRILVEEYITQQKTDFTFKGVCSYILYRAMEDGKVADHGALCEGNELQPADQERIKRVLEAILKDGRIAISSGEETRFMKK